MKRIKYLGIYLPKETKDLYIENYKTLVREIKEDTNRSRNIPCSWIRRINIMKMCILPKAIYRFNALPVKLPTVFFTELDQIISQFVWKYQKPQIAKEILSHSHQDSMVQAQRQNIDQWNKIESPEINPCTYEHFIFDKGGKNIQ